ncbi:hypothetical protein J2T17_004560 [Paenibacillus mucilaginosus]
MNDKAAHLPRKLTLTMWDFSWYTMTMPGEPYHDLKARFEEAVDRGYNTIRVCAMPYLLFTAEGKRPGPLRFGSLGKVGQRTRWYNCKGGGGARRACAPARAVQAGEGPRLLSDSHVLGVSAKSQLPGGAGAVQQAARHPPEGTVPGAGPIDAQAAPVCEGSGLCGSNRLC